MAIEDTKRLFTTWSEDSANKYLDLGWKLIAVGSELMGQDTVSIKYKLAWQNEGEPIEPEKPDWSKNEFL
jgi:hypothetical protein